MALFGWLKPRQNENQRQRTAWREAWSRAVETEDTAQLRALRADLNALTTDGDDVEMEEEMLDAAEQLTILVSRPAGEALPIIETHHRIAGADACHFSAPASLPDDPA